MKHLLYFSFFLASVGAWAQTAQLANPASLATGAANNGQPGFSRKQKTAAADPNLAQRLGATEAPLPANRIQPQTLRATGNAPMEVPPLRLRIVRDSKSGLPVYIENLNPSLGTNRNGRQTAQASAYAFLGQIRGLLAIKDPAQSFQIRQTIADDELGQTHYRMTQTHQGVPVYGAELAVHLTNGEVTLVNGQYQPIPATVAVQPDLSLAEAGKAALLDVGKTAPVRMFGQNMLKLEPVSGQLCIYAGTTDAPLPARLAYDLTVRPNLLHRWQYVIDAQTGAVLAKHNNTCSIDGSKDASARDLNGVTRTFKTYLMGNTYVMLDATRTMYDKAKSKLPNSPVGGLWTIDANNTYGENIQVQQVASANNTWNPTAASAQYNVGIAYEYFVKTFKRNSINGKGGTITSIINVNDPETGKGMDNAYWNGELMLYGNGDKGFKPLAGALDVAGHEMSHGVIQNTANLTYQGQSGAMNESFADVFGVLIDRANWTVGEDVVVAKYFPSGALRSMANPNQGGTNDNGYQPKTMAQYDNTTDDNGGVHINSGIPNYAFYLFASNASVGKDKAEQVYYRALNTYLTRSSKFLDLRLAIIKATGDLYGASGAEVAAAKAAFDAVGIVEGNSTPVDTKPTIPAAIGQDFIGVVDVGNGKLYSTTYPVSTFTARSLSKLFRRPSLTDDGKVAVFVGSDGKIRASSLTTPASETVISAEAGWANVAVSKDGTRLAALTDKQDGKIYVYSFDLGKWQTFPLYNPTTAQGVKTGEVAYADSFEWDYSGEYVIYDAYNKLKNASGTAVDYWDVGIMRAWDGAKKNFADGVIEKLFNSLPEGLSIGNPSFAKTAPNVIAFDVYDDNDQSYGVLGANIETGDVAEIYTNNTLGFPSFSRTDNAVVFGTIDKDRKEAVALIGIDTDKISPKGTVTPLITGAKWPVWYSNAARALPNRINQTLTFNVPASRFLNEGDLALSATSSANLPVSFKVMSGVGTLTGNVLKFSAVGSVVVRASQDGNAQTYAATPIDRTIDVQAILATEPAWVGELRLFPNPTRSRLSVELPTGVTWQKADLLSTGGAVVQRYVNGPFKPLELDVSALPTGLYVITIETDKGRVQRKVLRE